MFLKYVFLYFIKFVLIKIMKFNKFCKYDEFNILFINKNKLDNLYR